MALNRTSDVSAADWRSQTPVKIFFTCGDTVCLSSGNLYKALQFEKKIVYSVFQPSCTQTRNFELKNSSTLRNIFAFSAFFYPNTKFIYGDGLPDFKAVKQSSIKLQAVLSSKRYKYSNISFPFSSCING